MRAKLPDQTGFVERDGVRLHYEVYGSGPHTMLFIPPWSIVHSRVYKAQLPYFSGRFRCIAYDGRGNGKSDRPDRIEAYSLENSVADALAVMAATDTGEAILVGLSLGGLIACVLAAHHPERVKAAILAGTSALIGPAPFLHDAAAFPGAAAAVRGLEQVQPRALAGRLSRLCRALRPQHLLRAAFDQADRGRRRLGPRDRRAGAGEDGRGARDRTAVRCQRGDVSQDLLSAARHPRRQRPDPAACARQAGGRAERRRARDDRRAAATIRSAGTRPSATR